MSHTLYPLRRARLQRSTLAVPASNPGMIEKAAESAADVVFLDLEDAVAPPEKPQARKNAIAALNDIDWTARGKTVSVRINGLDTPYMYRDVVDVMEQAGDRLDMILIPKLGVYSDLYMVETMLNQIEQACGLTRKVGIEALIETALGMANVEDIAARAAGSGSRLEALHFGVADYAASMRARTVNIGGLNPAYPGDQWHASLDAYDRHLPRLWPARAGRPVRRFRRSRWLCRRRRTRRRSGVRGEMGHPSQPDRHGQRRVQPARGRITRARRIIAELREAEAQGKGAASLDGKMIDAASEKMAQNVLTLAEAIAARAPYAGQIAAE
jgi:citrate lyase beta subunit